MLELKEEHKQTNCLVDVTCFAGLGSIDSHDDITTVGLKCDTRPTR